MKTNAGFVHILTIIPAVIILTAVAFIFFSSKNGLKSPNEELMPSSTFSQEENDVIMNLEEPSTETKLRMCPDKWHEFLSPIRAANSKYYGQMGQFLTINNDLELIPASEFDLPWIEKNCEVTFPTVTG